MYTEYKNCSNRLACQNANHQQPFFSLFSPGQSNMTSQKDL